MNLKKRFVLFIAFAVLTVSCASFAKARGTRPRKGDVVLLNKVSNQIDLSSLYRPIESRVLSHRFVTREAMYLANEQILSAFQFFERAAAAGMPVVQDQKFFHITTVESYWYSRYNLSWLIAKSRMGIVLVHGPYLTLKAREMEKQIFYSRYRGERHIANREILFGQLIPLYLKRTGFPRKFEDASPLMLEFASGDPTLVRRVDLNDDFEGGNGQVDFEDSYLTLRWSWDRMEKIIDMGGVGQTLWKQVLWAEYFFKGKHGHGQFLGNDADEGFRGAMLTLMAVSKMLLIKCALFYDGHKLRGVNPLEYDPREGILYIPHRIRPELIMPGDIPPRPQWFTVKDRRSWLFDQSSLLLGFVEYVNYSDPNSYVHYALPDRPWPYGEVLGTNFPYDGSIMERKWHVLARGLAEMIIKNLNETHRVKNNNVLVSFWDPRKGPSREVIISDTGLTMVALGNYLIHTRRETDVKTLAYNLLKAQAEFLLRIQPEDGGFADVSDVKTEKPLKRQRSLRTQGLAVRGLLKAYDVLKDVRYLDAAKKTYAFMNRELWVESIGVYRSEAGAAISRYTPLDIAAAVGAVREMALATRDMNEIERFKVLHVQMIDRSGLMLAEEDDTGENGLSKLNIRGDGDGDGIPHFTRAGGKHGRAAVYAHLIEIKTPLKRTNELLEGK